MIQSLDLSRLVAIAAWVVLGLFVVKYLHGLSQDDDRFFEGMSELGTGIFYCGVLQAVAVWLGRNQP